MVLLSVPVGFGLLAYAFLVAGEDTPIATVSYVLSAYSLVVVCANAGHRSVQSALRILHAGTGCEVGRPPCDPLL